MQLFISYWHRWQAIWAKITGMEKALEIASKHLGGNGVFKTLPFLVKLRLIIEHTTFLICNPKYAYGRWKIKEFKKKLGI